jgi:hypothetical protein
VTGTSTELHVTLNHPEAGTITRVLRDPPDGGDHPRPAEALAALDAVDGDPFAPVPPGTIATMIYGGPETATVRGVWRGRPVDAEFNRTDGAQIHRWDRLAALLDIRH